MSKYEKYKSWKKFKSHLLTKWYTEWVESEFDLELLSMTKGMISEQELKIKTLLDESNRVVIKGYRK